jgi:hypothetical protein
MMKASIILVSFRLARNHARNHVLFDCVGLIMSGMHFHLTLQEIELFMKPFEKKNPAFFPKSACFATFCQVFLCPCDAIVSRFLHVIVPDGEAKFVLFLRGLFHAIVMFTLMSAGLVLVSTRASCILSRSKLMIVHKCSRSSSLKLGEPV